MVGVTNNQPARTATAPGYVGSACEREGALNTVKQESGFVLAMVLVFVVVLSVTMLVATSLGWTDMRVVTTIRDEKSAARIAEAGIAEGLKRLSMTAQSSVSVDGDTFDPSFAAAAGHTDCTQTTDLCPD